MLHSYFLCHLNLPGAGAQYGRPDTGPALRCTHTALPRRETESGWVGLPRFTIPPAAFAATSLCTREAFLCFIASNQPSFYCLARQRNMTAEALRRPDTGPALHWVASRHGHTFFAMLAEKSKTGGSKVKVGFIQWDVQRELEEEIARHYERK